MFKLVNNNPASVYVQEILIPVALLILLIALIILIIYLIKSVKSLEASLNDVEHKLKELNGPVNTISRVDLAVNKLFTNLPMYLKRLKK